ncbi:hypothetical protein COY25_01640 [Candidatus Uhrbacteria bacterium CG_4_10_14_0_2_um_filter_41_7]|uniref:Uncharacterized protein n=1 Tax=Candidatus Uhrbacteria bacterium CG_4_9_14_3_um_filter_41_35 TaxID=1975034 RepID=A0A2M7XD49_9BACT|nr:MAG: hypothetical protein COV92_04105 [Candidatus Uhrbacteria bacterium CG11_big_fil_rev_8_21_14_0_20_41_9]PIZ54887.1 MAG: hypothetical protein COY25_01640 [Candidatus Uhrbacteria bacterium CG_4_10_14_0_2_um_filter_41_7]PJA45807.1 MAG: hypothetical protein CO173_04525 [Candidatus Uhrbacteria bacterium CG_4_9_14_3_um_filter_41_35]
MKKTLGLLVALTLIGGGCVGGDASDTAVNDTVKQMANVPFSEVLGNILDRKDTYKEFRYTHESGDCLSHGAPNVISYFEDPNLGYFVVESGDGSYRESVASAMMNNEVSFNEVPLTDGAADCAVRVKYGEDKGTYICDIAGTVVCTSEVSAVGVLR